MSQPTTPPKELSARWAFIKGENTEIWLDEKAVKATNNHGRGPGLKGTIKDHKSGQTYKIYGASCGLPQCYCAWRAKPVKTKAT